MGMSVGKKGMNCEINMTPMIDVLLTLIIIFMIVLPSTHGERVDVPQQSDKEANQRPDEKLRTVVLQIHFIAGQRPELKLNDETLSWDQLQSRLKAVYEYRQEKVLFVKADSALEWQDVAPAIDTAHIAGVQNVGLLTERMQMQ